MSEDYLSHLQSPPTQRPRSEKPNHTWCPIGPPPALDKAWEEYLERLYPGCRVVWIYYGKGWAIVTKGMMMAHVFAVCGYEVEYHYEGGGTLEMLRVCRDGLLVRADDLPTEMRRVYAKLSGLGDVLAVCSKDCLGLETPLLKQPEGYTPSFALGVPRPPGTWAEETYTLTKDLRIHRDGGSLPLDPEVYKQCKAIARDVMRFGDDLIRCPRHEVGYPLAVRTHCKGPCECLGRSDTALCPWCGVVVHTCPYNCGVVYTVQAGRKLNKGLITRHMEVAHPWDGERYLYF